MTVIAAVGLQPIDAAAEVVAGNQPALAIAGLAVGVGGALLVERDALAGLPLHAPAAVDVAEQQVAALLPPDRSFGRPVWAAEAAAQLFGVLLGADDALHGL